MKAYVAKMYLFIQPTSYPVNDNLMELMVIADALKRASARHITAVVPYYGYARQDRKTRGREPITAKLVANLMQTAGITRLVTIDLHAGQIQGFFDIPVDHLMGAPLIADFFERRGMIGKDYVVVSPDHGGVTRARKLAEFLKTPIAIIDKRRSVDKMNTSEVMNIIGSVEGKTCILIDDMIDTAGTIVAGASVLKEKGAKDVYIACTHGVLSGPAIQRLNDCVAKEVVITDTIAIPEDKEFDKLVQISVAELLAHTIESIENNLPVSDVFTQFDFKG